MTYNTYIYAYTHINIISSLMQFEVIKWQALSKYTQKWNVSCFEAGEPVKQIAQLPKNIFTISFVILTSQIYDLTTMF